MSMKTVLWLSWLEHHTDNVGVSSSSLLRTTCYRIYGGLAQLARASALQAEGQRFESVILHQGRKLFRPTIFDMLEAKATK